MAPSGPRPDAVEPGAAHHADAPSRSGAGPEHGQGVVADEVRGRPPPSLDGASPGVPRRRGDRRRPGSTRRFGGRGGPPGRPRRHRAPPRWPRRGRPWPRRGRRTGGWNHRPGPSPAGCRRAATTQTSVFDAPPSTARTAGWADPAVCHLRPRGCRSSRRCYVRCVGTKVAVVGGGSTYTPELVDSLCAHEDRLVVDELVLVDPDSGPARSGRRTGRADPATNGAGRGSW